MVVKKYANRRLYNTATSSYVTLDDLATLIKEGGDFVVHDAKTGEDLTRSVLTQIIVEQEQKGQNLLPISFLRQLISFYGDSMQFLVPGYLEQAMVAFARNQEQMRKSLRATFGIFPFGQFEEMGKQNMALFEQALKMLSPYGRKRRRLPSRPHHLPKTKQRPKARPACGVSDPQIEGLARAASGALGRRVTRAEAAPGTERVNRRWRLLSGKQIALADLGGGGKGGRVEPGAVERWPALIITCI